MKELWLNFWTKQSYAIRGFRLAGVGIGTVLVAVDIPDETWGPMAKALGFALAGGSALVTGTDATGSGLPAKE